MTLRYSVVVLLKDLSSWMFFQISFVLLKMVRVHPMIKQACTQKITKQTYTTNISIDILKFRISIYATFATSYQMFLLPYLKQYQNVTLYYVHISSVICLKRIIHSRGELSTDILFDRTSQTPDDNTSHNTMNTGMTHGACKSKLRSVVVSSMLPCPGISMTIGRAVM